MSLKALTLILALSNYNLTASIIWTFDLGKPRFAILITHSVKLELKRHQIIVLRDFEWILKKKKKRQAVSQISMKQAVAIYLK